MTLRRTCRGVAAVGLARRLAVAAAGCAVPVLAQHRRDRPRRRPARPRPRSPAQPAQLAPCPEVPRQLVGRGAPNMTYDCATVAVPQDWARHARQARRQTFDIALIRVRADDQRDRIGSLLVNPGGPGGSGVDTGRLPVVRRRVRRRPEADPAVRHRRLRPARRRPVQPGQVHLRRRPRRDASATSPTRSAEPEFDERWSALDRRIGDGVRQASTATRCRLFSTEQAARDMDAIRAAVGDEKLTYLGYSYGTLLGATYAQLFPRNVRAHGARRRGRPAAGLRSPARRARPRASSGRSTTSPPGARRTPRPVPDRAGRPGRGARRDRQGPRSPGDRRRTAATATAGWVFYAVVSSLYTESGWPIAGRRDRRPAPGRRRRASSSWPTRTPSATPTAHYTNLFDANIAVNCADAEQCPTVERDPAAAGRVARRSTRCSAPPLAVGMLTCALWPGKRDPYPTGPADGRAADRGGRHDRRPGDAVRADRQAGRACSASGTVLTWEGEGHTAYPRDRLHPRRGRRLPHRRQKPAAGLTCPAS